MAGPIRFFQFLTDAELASVRATCIQQLTSGAFTSLSGAQKSSSQEWLDLNERLQALNLEINTRARHPRVQKVTQVLNRNCGYTYPGYP